MTELIQFVLTVGGFVLFISLGFFFGRRAERRHFRNLRRREAIYQDLMTTQ